MGRLLAWRKAFRYLVVADAVSVIVTCVLLLVMYVGWVTGDYVLFSNSFFMALCMMSLSLGLTAFAYSFAGISFTACTVLAVLPTPIVAFTAFSIRSWMFAGTFFVVRTVGLSLGFAGIMLGILGWWRLGKELGVFEEEKEGGED